MSRVAGVSRGHAGHPAPRCVGQVSVNFRASFRAPLAGRREVRGGRWRPEPGAVREGVRGRRVQCSAVISASSAAGPSDASRAGRRRTTCLKRCRLPPGAGLQPAAARRLGDDEMGGPGDLPPRPLHRGMGREGCTRGTGHGIRL